VTKQTLGRCFRYKGKDYEVTGTATHIETNEEMLICSSKDDNEWIFPTNALERTIDNAPTLDFKQEYPKHPVLLTSPETPKQIDLFTSTEPPAGIHMRSTPVEKIQLFLSLFTGREDVYAKRYENTKNGASGYVPACHRQWSPLCPKSGGNKMKCSECPNKDFIPFNANIVDQHLKGKLTAGAYAMLPDETCHFLAFDFDGKDYTQEDLYRDVSAIRNECNDLGISAAIERSRSGQGIHIWVFFSEAIPAGIARKFGSSLITAAMKKHHGLTMKTYDRLIPNQDTMPTGGFGNLIALPLQKYMRVNHNTEFINENFIAYEDQWNYLYNIKKHSPEEIKAFTKQLSPGGELGDLRKNIEDDKPDEKPWETKKLKPILSKNDFPDKVRIVRANMLYIEKDGISSSALNALKRLAAFSNPDFYMAQAMRLSTHDKPRIITCFDETEQYIGLPRGLENEAEALINTYGTKIIWQDETNAGRSINVTFNGALRGEQKQAADALLAHENGVLSATTAFGKTVIGAYLIANRKVNTLILVHRKNLLSQWAERLREFLIVNEDAPIRETPTGQKKTLSVIGRISGAKNEPSGIIRPLRKIKL
jgi:hypothetical protein